MRPASCRRHRAKARSKRRAWQVEDFGSKAAGKPIEIIHADHQNKTDIGAAIARRWIDVDGVDAIIDVPNSAIVLAVQEIAKEKAPPISLLSSCKRRAPAPRSWGSSMAAAT
jgi:ABC-type branched-subunit amino acid transport system substrate-binding protein